MGYKIVAISFFVLASDCKAQAYFVRLSHIFEGIYDLAGTPYWEVVIIFRCTLHLECALEDGAIIKTLKI